MNTRRSPFSSLQAHLASADSTGRTLWGPGQTISLADFRDSSTLDAGRDELAGKSILLITNAQLAAATALIELDGLVQRIVICPPDIGAEQYPVLIDKAAVDAIVFDDDLPALPCFAGKLQVRCGLPFRAAAPPTDSYATEWVLLTSGTTSTPKMIGHSLKTLTAAFAGRPASQGRPMWATFYDIRRYGGLQIFLRAVLGPGSLVVRGPHETLPEYLTRLGECGVTHLSGTPSHWRNVLMSAHVHRIAPGHVRLSGEIADQAILTALASVFPVAAVTHAFASTEAGVAFEVTDGRAGFPADLLTASGDVSMKLCDGALCIRSHRVAARYLDDAARVLADGDGYVNTGDMMERRGDRYFFLGRRNGVINVGGLKVYPETVEAVINRHPAVRMSRVQPRRNPITGALVAAEVMLAGTADPERVKEEILALCRRNLPAHAIPASLRDVPTLDVAPAGKLARHGA